MSKGKSKCTRFENRMICLVGNFFFLCLRSKNMQHRYRYLFLLSCSVKGSGETFFKFVMRIAKEQQSVVSDIPYNGAFSCLNKKKIEKKIEKGMLGI